MLVITGLEDNESTLQSVNIKNKEVKKIDYSGKFVSSVVSGGDRFVMQTEDIKDEKRNYASKLAMITTDNLQVQEINPEFLASVAYSLFVNPSGSTLVFTGVANNQYIVDLNNPESITKLSNVDRFTLGFVNETQIAFDNYLADDEMPIEVLDLDTDISMFIPLNNAKYNQIAIKEDAKSISYTQSKVINSTKINGLKSFDNSYIYYIPNYSFENIQFNSTKEYLLSEKVNNNNESNRTKTFAIFHLKNNYLSTTKIKGVKAIWVK